MYVIYGSDRDSTNIVSTAPLQINSCGVNTTRRGDGHAAADVLVKRPHGRLDYQLLYLTYGQAQFWLNGQWQMVREGQLVLYRPEEPQIYRISSTLPQLCRWVHFSGTQAAELLQACGMAQGSVFTPERCPEAEELLKTMAGEMQRKEPLYRLLMNAQFQQALALLGRRLMETHAPCSEHSRQKVMACVEYINRHYHELNQIDQLAAYCGMTKYHLIHTFRECMGVSPYAYLIQTRMERARSMLQSGGLGVAEVALLCGYNDPLYFSRAFSRHFGVAPSRYSAEQGNGPAT
ncbi:MAG: AraC family transcriptional regulator [Eubacteriales bacterium]|nr:AraC family transcriptional regulator [Eubacteriales bacterium]